MSGADGFARTIHPSAMVDPLARLERDVFIGPFCVVGPKVVLGRGTKLVSHVVIDGDTTLGEGNIFYPFAVIGMAPQVRRIEKEGRLVIGARNTFREHVTIHPGLEETRIGDDCLFMVSAHVAHDATVGSNVTVANGVQIAGHVVVEDHVNFGGLAAIAQHVRIGEGAFVAGGAMVERPVPPFVIAQGDRARPRGINRIGLERRGVSEEIIRELERAYAETLLAREHSLREAATRLSPKSEEAKRFRDALLAIAEP